MREGILRNPVVNFLQQKVLLRAGETLLLEPLTGLDTTAHGVWRGHPLAKERRGEWKDHPLYVLAEEVIFLDDERVTYSAIMKRRQGRKAE